MRRGRGSVLGLLMVIIGSNPALALDGTHILHSRCADCHALTPPTDPSIQRLWERKGPPLYYAGSKFKKEWLVTWLQHPTRIRPAGEFYIRHIKPGPAHDVVDETTLTAHTTLPQAEAEAVAEVLMTLTGPPHLIEAGAFKNEKVNPTLGNMFFTKLRGCAACHMAAPGKGGLSGPELYTAGQRLQPDYIYSYLKDPQRFDPAVWMPRLRLSEPDLQRLTGYLVQLAAQEEAQ